MPFEWDTKPDKREQEDKPKLSKEELEQQVKAATMMLNNGKRKV